MQRSSLWFISAWLLLLAGCAGVTTQTGPATAPDTGSQVGAQGELALQPDEVIPPEPEQKPVVSANPAIIALLDRAQLDSTAGQREAAAASLERALRIEPRNAWLWHELAQLRLSQGQYGQAIALAQKSSSFAGNERRLQALNWRVIGNARVAQGNPSGAEQAFRHAEALEQ